MSSHGVAEDGDSDKPRRRPGDIWRLPEPGHASKLRGAYVRKASSDGLDVKVALIPDAYEYNMAEEFEELHRRGERGKSLIRKLELAHRKHKKDKGTSFFLIRLESSTHLFFESKLSKHFRVTQAKKRQIHLREVSPKLPVQRWDIFEYPPGRARKFNRRNLAHLKKSKKMTCTMSVKSLKLDKSTPVSLHLAGITERTEKRGFNESVNTKQRQISCVEWSGTKIEDISLTFYPRKYRRPKPPKRFDELLERLGRK